MSSDPSTGRRFLSLPTTQLGWWSVRFGIGFLLFFGLLLGMGWAGQRGGDTFLDNLYLSLPALMAALSALIGAALSLIAIFAKGERSILDFGILGIGCLLLFLLVGELVYPH